MPKATITALVDNINRADLFDFEIANALQKIVNYLTIQLKTQISLRKNLMFPEINIIVWSVYLICLILFVKHCNVNQIC